MEDPRVGNEAEFEAYVADATERAHKQIDAGAAEQIMSEEWTWDEIDALYHKEGIMGIVAAHNAALAAERRELDAERREFEELEELYREACQDYYKAKIETDKAQQALAAEREKHPSHCVKHNTFPADDEPCWQCVNAVERQLREQLDAAKVKK